MKCAYPDTNAGSITANVELRKALNFDDKVDPKFIDADSFDIHAQIHSSSRKNFLNTGIKLELGDVLIINLDPKDLWNLYSVKRTWDLNANGLWASTKELANTCTTNIPGSVLVQGSLVGTLDGGTTLFPVGTHLEMTILNPGTLSLICWNNDASIYQIGSLRAFIKVVRRAIPVVA
ncbi:MAG: hypothetical protein PUP92_29915 [Rhizonema sp. PD38]|nr:hypothetical protein [Rhizonema sp. PD38]